MRTEPSLIQRTQTRPRIAFDVQGEGAAVLFLHGIGGNRHNWNGQLAHLGNAFRAIALDFRGYGDSDPVQEPFALLDFVADALAVLDALQIERAHVVGLSMGGLIAQALYARVPQRIISLTLAACRPAADPVLPDVQSDKFRRERLEPLRQGGAHALAQTLAPTLIGAHAPHAAREHIMESLRKVRPDSYVRVIEARMRVLPLPLPCGVPVLVMGAEEDRMAPPEQMRALAAAIPGARCHVFAQAGHLINLEKPQEFNAVLLDFLQRVCGKEEGCA